MKKQKTSIWERLRMAYRALTQDYYAFFGIDKDAIIWNDDGTYKGLDKKKMSMFSYISDDEKIKAYGKETNLHNFLWHFIEQFAKESKMELNVPLKEYHIEYTHTDAFIEKACEFLKTNAGEHIYFDECDHEWYDTEELINDFKNYMKGE